MWNENPALYEVAKRTCHQFGLPWTDPRTGITYQPPGRRKKTGKKRAAVSRKHKSVRR
jgi:hypothetical protein